MSLSFRSALRIGLAPGAVTLSNGEAVECDPGFGPRPWEGAVAALKAADIRRRATVVLSNHFVRYAAVPWSRELASDEEEEAYVRHHFAKIHGERARGWALRWTDHGETRLASAIDQGLLEHLRQALPRLVSAQPYLMAAINDCRKRIPKSGAWLALVEGDRACIALHADGRWRSVQNSKGAWLDLLERERHRAEGEVPQLAFVRGAEPAGELVGWDLRSVPGGLAH